MARLTSDPAAAQRAEALARRDRVAELLAQLPDPADAPTVRAQRDTARLHRELKTLAGEASWQRAQAVAAAQRVTLAETQLRAHEREIESLDTAATTAALSAEATRDWPIRSLLQREAEGARERARHLARQTWAFGVALDERRREYEQAERRATAAENDWTAAEARAVSLIARSGR